MNALWVRREFCVLKTGLLAIALVKKESLPLESLITGVAPLESMSGFPKR